MLMKCFAVIAVISVLWTTCLSQNECNSTIFNTSEIIVTCLSMMAYEELPLYNYATSQLANITSIVVNGPNNSTSGPFTSIPPNICLLPNLQSIDFSFNRIMQVDPAEVLISCLSDVTTFDVSYNNISEFPSAMIYNMLNLENLYFQHNQLTDIPSNAFQNASNLDTIDFSYNSLTNFELWVLLVNTSADFSHNQISMITNKLFFDFPITTPLDINRIYRLNNNSAIINWTDGVYEMYNSCSEVYSLLTGTQTEPSSLSFGLTYIDFGTTQINCSCDQSYTRQMLNDAVHSAPSNPPISNATCTDGTQFLSYTCLANGDPSNSSVDFSSVYPRQCKIFSTESGNLTITPNISAPTINPPTYPHYATQLMNSSGACFFAFSNTTTVRIKCTNDTSNSSTIPSTLLSSSYFSTITRIDFTYSISSLPSYVCSLPSRVIDLSFQSFTILSDATFPCLDWFNAVILSSNQLKSVNMTNGNFTNLNSLDLSSNQLTSLPYSILTPTPSSLRYLNLRNNSITSIDLFLYTLKNITVDLRDNPINSSSIINPQNVTIPSGNNSNSTVNITLPSSISNTSYIFNDQTALTAGACDRDTVLALRNSLQLTFNNVLLDCTCASINLKLIFLRSGSNITDSFTCSNGSAAAVASFSSLTMSSCASTALNFSMGLCFNESIQTFSNNTTTVSLSTTVQLTSTSITVLLTNLSSIETQNQQSTNSTEFEGSSSDLYTHHTTNTSNQLSTIYGETLTSKNSAVSSVPSISTSQMTLSLSLNITTNSGNTTTALSIPSSLTSISVITTMTDSNTTVIIGWTTTSTTTTTTTVTTSTTSSTTTTTSVTTSTTSSTTTTTSATTSTTSTTTTSVTTSTTSSTTTTTSATTSTTSTTTTSITTSTTSTTTTSVTTSTTSSTSTSVTTSTTSTTTTSTTSTTTTSVTTSTTSSTTTSVTTSTTSTTTTSVTTSTTSTTTTSVTTSTTSSTTTSVTTSTTSSTTTSVTTRTTSTTTTSVTTRTTSTTTTSVTTGIATIAPTVQSSATGSDSDTKRTGLIVGLVVGLVGFLALVGGLIAAIVIVKTRSAAAMNKPVERVAVISQAPTNALLQSRLQTRNLRPVRLAPLTTKPSQLPTATIATADSSTLPSNRSGLSTSARGIPIRLDPIRPPSNITSQYAPTSYASIDSSNFRPLPQQQVQEPRARQPSSNQMLNTGGDTHH